MSYYNNACFFFTESNRQSSTMTTGAGIDKVLVQIQVRMVGEVDDFLFLS